MTTAGQARPRRLDERVEPSWARTAEALLRYGGLVVGLLLLWLGFVTGGFFIVLTGVLAATAAVGGWLAADLVARESWYTRPNARTQTLLLVFGAPILLIGFAQLAGAFLTPPPVTDITREGTLSPDAEHVEMIAVDPRIDGMELTLDLTGMTGEAVRWYLADPTGQSVWSGRAAETGPQERLIERAPGGQWQLHLTSEGGSARYSLDWHGWVDGEGPDVSP